MNYIYDILLNFNSELYEVYDWNKNDNITHIRKIPFFKINTNELYGLLKNKVILSKNFLDKIYKKTEYFTKNKINNIDYSFLVTDGKEIVAIKYNKGNLKYSKLLYDEEADILEYSNGIKTSIIEFEIISPINIQTLKTRNEIYIKKYIDNEIKKMINNNDYDKLIYIYLECFNKKIKGDIYKQIYIDLEKYWDEEYLNIYNFLKNHLIRKN